MDNAAAFCADLVYSGEWRDAVAGKVTDYVKDKTWNALLSSGRPNRCRRLARMASQILEAKKSLHNLTGSVAGKIGDLVGMGRVERQFAVELAKKIPLPVDAKLTAVARGLQVTGILICLADGIALDHCHCFVDLARTELKEQVKKILVSAEDDWADLAGFPSRTREGLILDDHRRG